MDERKQPVSRVMQISCQKVHTLHGIQEPTDQLLDCKHVSDLSDGILFLHAPETSTGRSPPDPVSCWIVGLPLTSMHNSVMLYYRHSVVVVVAANARFLHHSFS